MRSLRVLLASVVLAVVGGCQETVTLPTVPVNGRVTQDGKPVEGAAVTFVSSLREGKAAHGQTDADGKFTLNTFVAGENFASGALPGEYKVMIMKVESQSLDIGSAMNMAEAGLRSTQQMQSRMGPDPAKVKALMGEFKGQGPGGGQPPGNVDFGSLSQAPKSLLPQRYADPKTSPLTATVKTDGNEPFNFDLTEG